MRLKKEFRDKLIVHINRKKWWHVPPRDPSSYAQRGIFFASSFSEAEFWGRPLDEPQRVRVANPLVGDEDKIERMLLNERTSTDDIAIEDRWALDARLRRAGLVEGFDSIVVVSPDAFAKFLSDGKIPYSMELNILNANMTPETATTPTRKRSVSPSGEVPSCSR
jgi:hypothetical protein